MQQILQRLDRLEALLLEQKQKPLSIGEAADYMGVSKSFLYKLTHENRIRYYKPSGKRVYFEKKDLDAFLLQNPVRSMSELRAEAVGLRTGRLSV